MNRDRVGNHHQGHGEPSYAGGDTRHTIEIVSGASLLAGSLVVPDLATRLIIFAGNGHAPGSNEPVASMLQDHGLATLTIDLLAPDEVPEHPGGPDDLRLDIGLLAERLAHGVDWAVRQDFLSSSGIGLFGSDTGAGAALAAAAMRAGAVRAVVLSGGRPESATDALPYVRAPTLLIVGGMDEETLELTENARRRLTTRAELKTVPGASHDFTEPGAVDEVARLAALWFDRYLEG